MSLGGNPLDHQEHYIDRAYAEGAMGRAAKAAKSAAGRKSFLQRLRRRLRPRPEPDRPGTGGQNR